VTIDMSDSSENVPRRLQAAPPTPAPLDLRLERLRSLRSAFGALAPSAVTAAGREIAEAGRALTQRLAQAKRDANAPSSITLTQIDTSLDAFESTMRRLAVGVAVAQLRSTLPGRMSNDRRSVLDLLDLMLGEGVDDAGKLSERIGSIDYLITLLCTHGARRHGIVAHDPTSLTPRLAALCARLETEDEVRVSEIATEFFAAANMDTDRVREEIQRRSLRQRKVELGSIFFEPRILRAIVTYNAAQLERVTDAILDAGDWGVVEIESASEAASEDNDDSVFASTRLRRIASAVRQRIRGEAGSDSAERRIAIALDLETLANSELEALEAETVGSSENPIGTAILVGLMCRSLAVLAIELQTLGLSADQVSDVWVEELDARFRHEIEDKLANDAYKQACALTELKNKFLFAPLADRLREEHVLTHSALRKSKPAATETSASTSPAAVDRADGGSPGSVAASEGSAKTAPRVARSTSERTAPSTPTRPARPERRERARDLVREALEDDRRGRDKLATPGRPLRSGLFVRIAQAAVAAIVIAVGLHLYLARSGRDLQAFSRDQLGSVSPYLVEGHRNGQGRGPGFVGTLDDSWKSLPHDGRQAAAEALVLRLREHGLQQVMIYDRDRMLRIQAIGSQPIRSL
jgi:hypothetical protein